MNIKGFPDLLKINPSEIAKPKVISDVKPELKEKINFNKDTFEISPEARERIQENSVSFEEMIEQRENLAEKKIEPLEVADISEFAKAQRADFERVFSSYYKQLQRMGVTDRTPLANAFKAKMDSQ